MRLLFFIAAWAGLSLQAQQLPGTIPWRDDVTVDGDVGEWGEANAVTFDMFLLPQVPRVYNNRIQSWLAWDEQHLYVAFHIRDAYLCKQEKGIDNPRLYLGDAVEVYIDPAHDSGSRMDINDYQIILDAGDDYCILKGDKQLIKMADKSAPKEPGIATLVLEHAVTRNGNLNDNEGRDQGWTAELALPWAGIGVMPREGMRIKLDLCVNDLDTTADMHLIEGEIPSFNFTSWLGSKDFSFPDRWPTFTLSGGPGTLKVISRKYSLAWLLLFIFTAIAALAIISLLVWRIRQLKNVPVRAELPARDWSAFMEPPPQTPGPESSPPLQDPFFQQLRQLIIQKADTDLKPASLAAELGMSLRSLQTVFKEKMNTTPGQFITVIKMELAMDMLRSGGKNVNETAWALGYTDPGYFSRVFRKYFGHSPSEARAKTG